MIVFNNKTLQILRFIRKHNNNGVTWGKIQKKFGRDEANIFLLEALSKELYIVTQNFEEQWIDFKEPIVKLDPRFVSYTTPKADEILENKSSEFLKWMIPTIISVIALLISIFK